MSLLTVGLAIGGTSYNLGDHDLVLDAWGWDLDGDFAIEFHQEGPTRVPTFTPGQSVTLSLDSTQVAFGQISSGQTRFDPSVNWVISYRVRGPKYLANLIWVTSSTGTGIVAYNLPPMDDDYIPSMSGLSLGTILSDAFTLHAAALAAVGITTDSTTASQFAALTLVPFDPVILRGRLWNALEDILRDWAKHYAIHITGSGLVRLIDTTTGTTFTLDEGDPVGVSYSVEDSAPRTQVRGSANVYPFYATFGASLLTQAWGSGDQAAWNYDSWLKPGDAFDSGTVTTVLSASSVRVQSSNATLTHGANFWSDREAWLYLYHSAGTGLTFSEQRPVTASTAMTAGGTMDLTLAYPLDNASSSAYDSYKLVGRAGTIASGSLVDVWRLYNVNDPGGIVANHLVKAFPKSVPFVGYYGDSEVDTLYPIALIINSDGRAFPATFKIVPQTGQIRFDEPVAKVFNSQSDLALGGSHVTAPADIYVMLAYSRGALTATYPADISGVPQYAGTAYSWYGMTNTAYFDIPDWIYAGNQSQFDDYAAMQHAARKDVIVEATISQKGYHSDLFAPGWLLNVTADTTTGLEAINAPVRGYRLEFVNGEGGLLYREEIRVSTRRNPATGDRYYVHPTQLNQLGFKFLGDFDPGQLHSAADVISGQGDPNVVGYQKSVDKSAGNIDNLAAKYGSEFGHNDGVNPDDVTSKDVFSGSNLSGYNPLQQAQEGSQAPIDASGIPDVSNNFGAGNIDGYDTLKDI